MSLNENEGFVLLFIVVPACTAAVALGSLAEGTGHHSVAQWILGVATVPISVFAAWIVTTSWYGTGGMACFAYAVAVGLAWTAAVLLRSLAAGTAHHTVAMVMFGIAVVPVGIFAAWPSKASPCRIGYHSGLAVVSVAVFVVPVCAAGAFLGWLAKCAGHPAVAKGMFGVSAVSIGIFAAWAWAVSYLLCLLG